MTKSERFQVLVVGAGPAGIAAAAAAAPAASERHAVGIVDDNPAIGGQVWRGGTPLAGDRLAARSLQRFPLAKVTTICGTQIVAQPEPGILLAERDGRPIELRYGKLVLATGARERFLPFPGWTLPNVFGAGGLQALVKSGFPVSGKRVIVAGSGPLLLSVAACVQEHGAVVPLVAEQAPWHRVLGFGLKLTWLGLRKLLQGGSYRWAFRGTRHATGCWPTAVHGTAKVEAVTFRAGKRTWTEPCDMLACGVRPGAQLGIATAAGLRGPQQRGRGR